jgi:hypothetical protein
MVTSAKRVLRGSATTSDVVANGAADFVYCGADDSQEPFARGGLVHGALERVGRDRARLTAHEPLTPCTTFRVSLASYRHVAGSSLGDATEIALRTGEGHLGARSALPHFACNHDDPVGIIAWASDRE